MNTAATSRLVRLEADGLRALVYPEQGFQLHALSAAVPGRAGGQPVELVFGPAEGREPADRRYGNPVLFPSAGVTFGAEADRWTHDGRLLPMQQHGWARDAYWHVEAIDGSSVTGVLVPTTGIRASYPFPFELRLRYALAGGALVLDAELANRGVQGFPYVLGFHPYLRAPLAGGARRSSRVRLPAGVRLQSSDSWRKIDRAEAPARTIDAADAELPGSIVLAETGATALEVEDAAAGIATRVSVEGSAQGFPVWVAWSAAPDAPYVCLEPWTDAPNALNRPETRRIDPGATHRYQMTISARAM
jgi:galactose mutarotase-like enzyme